MAAKVLLVEDDNNLREIYEARLKAEGYDIVSAQDGEEALVVAKNEKPDLIISDVMMPKISGFEMLDILRNTDGLKEVKIIMLTALGQAEDKTRADKLGANKYLVKSQVTLEDIVTTAHQLLDDTPAAPAPAPTPVADPVAAQPAPAASPAAPAPSVEPVATAIPVAIAPEPAPAPAVATPTPAAPVSAPVAAAPAPSAPAAQTTAQEEADMKNQIESFVNSTPAAPAADPSAPTSPSDQVMQSAVNDMVASTEPQPTSSSETLAVEVPPSAPTVQPAPTPAPGADEPQNDSVAIAHKKIIKPLDAEPKPDLNALLAAEEAHTAIPTADEVIAGTVSTSTPAAPAGAAEEAAVPPAPSGSVVTPTQPTTPPQPGNNADPNNIAL